MGRRRCTAQGTNAAEQETRSPHRALLQVRERRRRVGAVRPRPVCRPRGGAAGPPGSAGPRRSEWRSRSAWGCQGEQDLKEGLHRHEHAVHVGRRPRGR